MKKYLILAVFILVTVSFSGCGSTDTGQKENKTYEISKSIWKSTDGGETWEARDESADKLDESDLNVLNIAINPSNKENILVGFKNGGYIESKDGGNIWKKTIFVSDRVYGLAFDPINPKIIYASGVWESRGKLFRSSDSGEKWEELFTSPSNGPFIVALSMDQKNPRILYASTSDKQAMKSEDGGITWKNIYQSKSPIIKMSIDMSNSQLVYAITLDGQVIRSSDGGTNFEDIGKNFSRNSFSIDQEYGFLEADPQNSGWVYLTGKGGILRSKDAGNTWEKIIALNDPKSYPVTALAINPKNSQEIIYGAGQAVYKSVDGGQNWSTSQFDTKKIVSVIKYDPVDSKNIYLGFKEK